MNKYENSVLPLHSKCNTQCWKTPGTVILAAVEDKSAWKSNKKHILSFIINTHESTAAAWTSAGVQVEDLQPAFTEARKKKKKEKTVYDEKKKNVILSVDFIATQARSVFEHHNYTECKISRSEWIMKIQPSCIIYVYHQNNINISRWPAVKLHISAQVLHYKQTLRPHSSCSSTWGGVGGWR